VSSLSSILLVDDNPDTLETYAQMFRSKTQAKVLTAQYPSQALALAKELVFDIVMVDVTIDYHGSPFGGLDVYRELLSRYGKASLIAYSQYITDDLLQRYNFAFNFLEVGRNPVRFTDKILALANRLRQEQSCFVAMPFSSDYDELFRTIERCVTEAGYRCVRVDQQSFTKPIIERVLQGIRDAKFIVFVATDRNPNAYYECGFSVALEKEVVIVTDFFKNLPFDVRDRNALAYGRSPDKLAAKLPVRIRALTEVDKQ